MDNKSKILIYECPECKGENLTPLCVSYVKCVDCGHEAHKDMFVDIVPELPQEVLDKMKRRNL